MKTSSKILLTIFTLILLVGGGYAYLQIKNNLEQMRIDNCIETHPETLFISSDEIVKKCESGELK